MLVHTHAHTHKDTHMHSTCVQCTHAQHTHAHTRTHICIAHMYSAHMHTYKDTCMAHTARMHMCTCEHTCTHTHAPIVLLKNASAWGLGSTVEWKAELDSNLSPATY